MDTSYRKEEGASPRAGASGRPLESEQRAVDGRPGVRTTALEEQGHAVKPKEREREKFVTEWCIAD